MPLARSSPHTCWNFSGSKKIGSQPLATRAVSATDLPIRLAQNTGMSARFGWLISFSGLPSPVPWPAGSGTWIVWPS